MSLQISEALSLVLFNANERNACNDVCCHWCGKKESDNMDACNIFSYIPQSHQNHGSSALGERQNAAETVF